MRNKAPTLRNTLAVICALMERLRALALEPQRLLDILIIEHTRPRSARSPREGVPAAKALRLPCLLVGPWALLTSAFSRERIASTASYIGSAALTMISATHFNSTLLTMVALGVQFFCAAWLAMSYLPFGQSFLGMAARNVLPL